jgi:hypothetical protein|nr:MAG: hypothetical protein [Bacteriophage sp.]UWG84497.1 MAG: hypothetical protein [Bacteriophage sp.]
MLVVISQDRRIKIQVKSINIDKNSIYVTDTRNNRMLMIATYKNNCRARQVFSKVKKLLRLVNERNSFIKYKLPLA